jgi:hypothetical protein
VFVSIVFFPWFQTQPFQSDEDLIEPSERRSRGVIEPPSTVRKELSFGISLVSSQTIGIITVLI